MDTRLINRLDAARAIYTLRKQFGASIDVEPILKAIFDTLDGHIKTADGMLILIANRSDAPTVDKDAKRTKACELGAALGAAIYVMAIRKENGFLQAQAAGWRSATGLRAGNRELVLGRLRAILKSLNDHSKDLVPDYVVAADITAFEAKIEAYSQSLEGKAESNTDQKKLTADFKGLISQISSLLNDQLTLTMKSLSTELPQLFEAYTIARRVKKTVMPTRSRTASKQLVSNGSASKKALNKPAASASAQPIPAEIMLNEGVHAMNGASK